MPHRQGGEEGTAFPPQGPGAAFHQLNSLNPLYTHTPPTHLSNQGGEASRKGRDNYYLNNMTHHPSSPQAKLDLIGIKKTTQWSANNKVSECG